jgi:hypothetical protein
MVRNVPAIGERRLGGADVETSIELQRIAIDNFTPRLQGSVWRGDIERQRSFTGPRWSGDYKQKAIHPSYRSVGGAFLI